MIAATADHDPPETHDHHQLDWMITIERNR